jgi:hypothetical protein
LIGGWQESTTNLALRDVVEATVGQRRIAGHRSQWRVELCTFNSAPTRIAPFDLLLRIHVLTCSTTRCN